MAGIEIIESPVFGGRDIKNFDLTAKILKGNNLKSRYYVFRCTSKARTNRTEIVQKRVISNLKENATISLEQRFFPILQAHKHTT